MSRHTPGPWYFMGGGVGVTNGLDLEGICYFEKPVDDAYDLEVWLANARLIAAAPKLLEELRDRYDMTKCGCGHPACSRCKDDEKTLAVIREAEGETE